MNYENIDASLRHDNTSIKDHDREIRTAPAYSDTLDITFGINFFRRVLAVHNKFWVLRNWTCVCTKVIGL